MQRPDNIGSYFYNLAPQSQALRIEEFATRLLEHNPGLPLAEVGNALRFALRSMGVGETLLAWSAAPNIRVVAGALDVTGRGYHLTITPAASHIVFEDPSP